ncbi:VCBS repeat-containing protein [candidate division KSB1 bacterium]|nr:VCBS repeat-containing protein [candidate division KSB1 bacterium]
MKIKVFIFLILLLYSCTRADDIIDPLPSALPAPEYGEFPLFESNTIDSDVPDGYRVYVTDLNNDYRPDIIALSTYPSQLVWYRNPDWGKHIITTATNRNIDIALYDINGDGLVDLALASDFDLQETTTGGVLNWLKNPGPIDQEWPIFKIGEQPTSHRIRWADINWDGEKELINLPILGPGAREPEYNSGVKFTYYTIPDPPDSALWEGHIIDSTLTAAHGISVISRGEDFREDLLTASFEGINLFSASGFGNNLTWTKKLLTGGFQSATDRRGCSEVVQGKLYYSNTSFLATIEPWHGNQLVVYLQENGQDTLWSRHVIDNTFTDGHALACADLDFDGNDEIVAGYRGGNTSLYLYRSYDGKGIRWQRTALDEGNMGAAGVYIEDINQDGLPDIAAIGTKTRNIKWYKNIGPGYNRLEELFNGPELIVVEKGLHAVSFYTFMGNYIKSIDTGIHPHEMVLSANGRFAYITDTGTMRDTDTGEGGETITVIDLQKKQKAGIIGTGQFSRPHAIRLDAETGLLAVGTENPGRVIFIDPYTQEIIKDYELQGTVPHFLSVSSGAEWVYTSNTQSDSITAINRMSDEIRVIPVGKNPQGSVLFEEGNKLFVTCRDYISVIDVLKVEEVDRINRGALRIALTPDRKQLIYASRDKGIGFADPETYIEHAYIQLPDQPCSLSISRDGKYAFTAAELEEYIYIISIEQQKVIQRFKTRTGSMPDPVMDIPE